MAEVSANGAAGASGHKRSPIHDFLPDGHIRLFEIDLEPGGTITGKLQTAKIGGGATYFALSYVCGTGADDRKISVDGEVFKVKANLYNALETLRSYFRGEKAPTLYYGLMQFALTRVTSRKKPGRFEICTTFSPEPRRSSYALVMCRTTSPCSCMSWLGTSYTPILR